ncbi:proteinase inhibitor I3 [Tanacetum coccineum]
MFVLTGTKREKYLKTSLVLGITSGVTKSACDKSIFWTIDTPEAKPPLNLITLGGRLEEDFTCFQLLEYPKPTNPKVHSYKLQNCPLFCGVPGYNQTCFNVSIYVDNGVRHLATDDTTPFEFVFHKFEVHQSLISPTEKKVTFSSLGKHLAMATEEYGNVHDNAGRAA